MLVFPDESLQNPPNLLLPPCSPWHRPNSAHPFRAGKKKRKKKKGYLAPSLGASALLTGPGGSPPFKKWGHSLSVDPTNKQSQAYPALPAGKQPIPGEDNFPQQEN